MFLRLYKEVTLGTNVFFEIEEHVLLLITENSFHLYILIIIYRIFGSNDEGVY